MRLVIASTNPHKAAEIEQVLNAVLVGVGTGLAGTGLAGTGLAGTGLAGTGLAGAGLAGKIEVISPAGLSSAGLSSVAKYTGVVEDGETLEDNALLKVQACYAATGEASIADDTGLEVDALGGAPGVRTARFAGEAATDAANRQKLLAELADVSPTARGARFRTVVAVKLADTVWTAQGSVEGTIATAEKGSGGFGYDSLFIPTEGDGRTFAEMSASDKHAISHRGRALRSLADWLSEYLAD